MTLTVSEASRAYREKRKAKLQRLAVYEAALESIARDFPAECDWQIQACACQIVARQALAAERFELGNGA